MSLLFLTQDDVLLLHKQGIDEFGGTNGLRDAGTLESALPAAENRAYYEQANLVECAATYAYHLSQAHAFIDGNKRIAASVAELFIRLNGFRLMMTNAEIVELFLNIAAGQTTRDDVEQLFEQRIVKAE
ncbi:MAG TPA: type II toxin-antitoxin system death-on-curing family toxin [Blastocatellia bacterium]|nr:type II toxin-antitoxin system death-on-curing family toxin [Blastocatellia bacterium]HMV86920.1 type II toxin-antitoxin system death-on-curing family toxin [Blastocatellia bacterium]HMX25173.1 type II toxin-antitoxin system death-on-curing family toxin [Blastocatellia bacterium]HMY74089.1 type II toxin-antitoxin system death-on-curing family toxin [Blastocatellia bacterium]HMZ19247.1 type II toxin-antitoxin system death-on-curing family toxin [Blastocatellia bacterium]